MNNLFIVLLLAVVLTQVSNVNGVCKLREGLLEEGVTIQAFCYSCLCTGDEFVCDGNSTCPSKGTDTCITFNGVLKKGDTIEVFKNICKCLGDNIAHCAWSD